MTKYTWIRVPIDIYNRDRAGGHGATYVTDECGYREPYSPEGARFLKKETRRKQRREHQKVTRAALMQYEEDAADYVNDYLRYLNGYSYFYEDHPSLDDWGDYLDENPDFAYEDDHPGYYAEYPDYFDEYYMADFPSHMRQEDPHDRIIKEEDAGKSLGDLLQEMIDRKELRLSE